MLGISFVFSSSLCCICLVPPCTPVPSPALPSVRSRISPSLVARISTLRENCSTVCGLCLLALQLLLPDGNTLSTFTCVYDMLVLQVLLNARIDRRTQPAAVQHSCCSRPAGETWRHCRGAWQPRAGSESSGHSLQVTKALQAADSAVPVLWFSFFSFSAETECWKATGRLFVSDQNKWLYAVLAHKR